MEKAMLTTAVLKKSTTFASGQPEKARLLLMEMQSRCIALRDEMSMPQNPAANP